MANPTIAVPMPQPDFVNEDLLIMNAVTETAAHTSDPLSGVPGTSVYSWRPSTTLETTDLSKCNSPRLTEKLERFLLTRPETPFLAVGLDVIEARYRELRHHFPGTPVYYAVKANPEKEIVALLAALGSRFRHRQPLRVG